MYDLLILNGRIVSGMGNPWYRADVAVVQDKIVNIGRFARKQARRVIDAEGCVVSPGFIDGHSHSDLFILADPRAPQKIMQGVTTEILGMDGLSVAPVNKEQMPQWRKHLSGVTGNPKVDWAWQSLGDYFDAIKALPISINVGSYAGLGTIRYSVMGMADREPSPQEVDRMVNLAVQSMEQGARGISSGLIYPPSQYQSIGEIAEIAKAVREYHGIYNVHIRSEGDRLFEAMEEAIAVGRQSAIPVIVTHFKVSGKPNWGLSGKALETLDKARQGGIEITIDQYPYTAGSTTLLAVIPPWFQTLGPDRLIRMLRSDREPIRRDIQERDDWENLPMHNGWENIFVSSVDSEANRRYEGKNIAEIALIRGCDDPADAALDLLADEELAVGMIIFHMDEADVVRIMKHPTVGFITDGLLGGTKPHPRVYGTYPRILGRYVRDQKILPLEEAVRKMTSLPAEKLRLKGKGAILENYDADITVFHPDTVFDRATYDDPRQFSSGIEWVIVNGAVVVEKGAQTDATPGRILRAR